MVEVYIHNEGGFSQAVLDNVKLSVIPGVGSSQALNNSFAILTSDSAQSSTEEPVQLITAWVEAYESSVINEFALVYLADQNSKPAGSQTGTITSPQPTEPADNDELLLLLATDRTMSELANDAAPSQARDESPR